MLKIKEEMIFASLNYLKILARTTLPSDTRTGERTGRSSDVRLRAQMKSYHWLVGTNLEQVNIGDGVRRRSRSLCDGTLEDVSTDLC